MLSTLRIAIVGSLIVALLGAFWYVSGLRADLERSQQNVATLESAVEQQSEVIDRIRSEQEQIIESRDQIQSIVRDHRESIDDLRSRFRERSDGSRREFGELAEARPGLMMNIINNASADAIRCVEIASGAPLTEEEQNEGSNSQCDFDTFR